MTSYIESTLSRDENIVYRANISLWSLAPLIIVGIILLPAYLIGAIPLIWVLIYYKSTEIALTNKRVIAKFGFISRNTIEINLVKIESIQVHQGIFGRIFNYGTLIISGAGTPKAQIPNISRPLEFRKEFNQIIENMNN